VLVGVGVSVGGSGVSVGVGVSVGDSGVSVGVGVGVDVSVGAAQLLEMVCTVPSTLVNVAVRLDPAGLVTPMLLVPLSENGASIGPPGPTLYVPLIVVPGLADEASVNTAFALASEAHVTLSASGCGVLVAVDVGVTVGEGVVVGVWAAARTLLKPSTVLPACPVTCKVRQFGYPGV
jgi:hypothetical protein